MSQLPLYDPDINAMVGEKAGTGMTKPVDVNPLVYSPEYTVAAGQFSNVAGAYPAALVTCQEKTITIVGPTGYPIIKVPRCLLVNSNDPALVSFSFEYDDGSLYRVNIRHPQRENLVAPELGPEGKKEDAPIPGAGDALGECPKEPL